MPDHNHARSPLLIQIVADFCCLCLLFSGPLSRPVQAADSLHDTETQPLIRLSAGKLHSAMLLQDGSLYLWGDNTYGQIGPDGTDYLDRPATIDLPGKAADVSLGADHTLILLENGSVYTLGRNTFGQLGDGSTRSSDRLVKVEGLPPVQAISAGFWHSLVLCRDGSVWGWGDNTTFQLGALQGEAIRDTTGVVVGYRQTRPVKIVAEGAAGIAAGGQFSIYLRQDGQLFAWGDNSRGQLGDGTTQTRSHPTAVVGLSGIRQVSAGYQHVLAMTNTSGYEALYAWGDHSAGQLGLPDLPAGDSIQPLPHRIDVTDDTDPGNDRIDLISAGYAQSVAVVSALTDQGLVDETRRQVLVWGDNSYGQLGLGHTNAQALPQTIISRYNGFSGDDYLPFTAVAAGGFHLLLMSSKGLLAACGRGDRGQLGTRSVMNRSMLSSVRIPDLIRPGWLEGAAVAVTRSDAGEIELHWPAAQDNIGTTGYKVRLLWSDGSKHVADIGLRQYWIFRDQAKLAGKEQLAVQVGVYAYDAAGHDARLQSLSHLSGFLAPPDDAQALQEAYFSDPATAVYLIDAEQHAWRPTGSGLLQPLEVPWDVRLIYGADALPDPPSDRLLKILSLFALVLWLTALAALIRSGLQARRQKQKRPVMHSPPVKIRRL